MTRRERRAKESSQAALSTGVDGGARAKVPLSHPPAEPQRAAKTLYELAAERQAQLTPQDSSGSGSGWFGAWGKSGENVETRYVRINADGSISSDESNNNNGGSAANRNAAPALGGAGAGEQKDDESESAAAAIPPILDTLLLAASLSALHFTLSVLTAHQYAMELRLAPIAAETAFVAFPTLALLVHLAHGHLLPAGVVRAAAAGVSSPALRSAGRLARQAALVGVANAAGCYLVYVTNDRGYYAVMKRAPGLGTVWVGAVLELGLGGALAGVAGPAAYAWWNGYGFT